MITRILIISSLGILLGYLSGYNFAYSAAIIKLSILILFINIFFIKKVKQDLLFKKFIILITIFILFFIVSSIRGNILKKDFKNINIKTNLILKIYDVIKKDNTQIIKGEIKKYKLTDETKVKMDIKNINSVEVTKLEDLENTQNKIIKGNVVIYTFSQEKYMPGMYLEIEGRIQNELIILPKKENETHFDENSGKSFDLLKYWNTRNVDFISMYPKIKILNIEEELVLSINENTTTNLSFLENIKNKLQDNIFTYSYKFRNYFYESLVKTLNTFDAGIVMAMLWGDENNISKETNGVFKNTGTSHILVLSGYNLIIVAALASVLFRKLSLRKKVIASVIFIVIFLLLAHTSSPVWRAALMSLYTMMTILFLKQSNAKLALFITCFIFLIYSPTVAMYDASFHLSFLATFGIIYFYPELEILIKNKFFSKIGIIKNNNINKINKNNFDKNNFNLENKKIFDVEKYKKWELLISTILVTVSANILIAPYIIFQFGYFKFSSILFSILVTPFVPVIMLLGFVIGSVNMITNILSTLDIFLLNIFLKLILLITKSISLFLEIIITNIFNFLKYFSDDSAIISNAMSFTNLIIIYIIIFLIFNYLVFINKNNQK